MCKMLGVPRSTYYRSLHSEPSNRERENQKYTCPFYLPISSINTRYYFQTNLEIKSGLDSKDRDYVNVYPQGIQKNFLAGFQELGFVHHSEGYTGSNQGTQIIQFRPTSWLAGKYDEIVFSYQAHNTENTISGHFELDKKTSGLLGMIADELDLDEKKGHFHFSANQLGTVEQAASTIRQFILRNSKDLMG